jgi:hypothetical protein
MSFPACPRLFEAEAMRDGRLGEAERATFERHTKTCPECAREVEALDALARALRGSAPEQADELRGRRERTRLLAAFDRELLVPEWRPSGSFRFVWALAAVLVVALIYFWRARPPSRPVPPAAGAVVLAGDGAAWSERFEGDREEVLLHDGALSIHVEHAPGRRRLVVVLPDGELEDTGTTFTVAAENGHTTRVAVVEGAVVLRLHAEPPVTIGSGETWMPSVPAPPASVSAASSSEPPPELPPEPPPSASHLPSPVPSAPVPSASPAAPPADASLDFRAATSALDRGDNREAAAGFAAFLAKHPRDSRAEDAAYLRVIALERCGDRGAMKAAALEYLERYPAGFRRAEVEKLSR